MNQESLKAYKCNNCGRVVQPKRYRCLSCGGREFDGISVQGDCKLVTFTDVWNLPWGIDERSRLIGIVEFENGLRAMGWIKAQEAQIGMTLKASWEPVRVIGGEEVHGLTLVPAT